MKDIGYYAGFLTTEHQEKINNAHKDQLIDFLADIATELYSHTEFALRDFEFEPEPDDIMPLQFEWHEQEKLSATNDRSKLALIRGICDRIELRLMEAAK